MTEIITAERRGVWRNVIVTTSFTELNPNEEYVFCIRINQWVFGTWDKSDRLVLAEGVLRRKIITKF